MFYNFDRPGKGIDPNEPKKEGFALFFDILYREFWAIMWLNVHFLLFSLPLVTIGASYAAMNSVLIRMVRDVPVDAGSDFRDAFKDNWKQGTLSFLLFLLWSTVLFINYFYYGVTNQLLQVISVTMAVFLACYGLYVVPISVSVDLPFKNVLKNSFFLAFLNLKNTVLAAILFGLIYFLQAWYFFQALIFTLLLGFALPALVVCFLVYPSIVKYCLTTEEALEEMAKEAENRAIALKNSKFPDKKPEESPIPPEINENEEDLDAELAKLQKELEDLEEQ